MYCEFSSLVDLLRGALQKYHPGGQATDQNPQAGYRRRQREHFQQRLLRKKFKLELELGRRAA